MSLERLKFQIGTKRLMLDLLICFSGLYIFRSYPMPKVVTFSVFLPSLSSSSAVWVQPRPHHTHSNNARIFFMVPRELDRLIRHQRKGPHRAAGGHAVGHQPAGDAAAPPGEHGHVLPALVRVGDRRRVDRRAGLELPQRPAVVLVER